MDLREITAVATRLRPQIQASAKQRDIASGNKIPKRARFQGSSGRNPSDKFDELKSSAKTTEERNWLAKEDRRLHWRTRPQIEELPEQFELGIWEVAQVEGSYRIRKLTSEVFDLLVASTLNARSPRMGTLRLKRSQSFTTLEIHPLNLSYRTAASGKKLLRAQGFAKMTFDLEESVSGAGRYCRNQFGYAFRDVMTERHSRRSSLTLLVYITHGRSTIPWP